MKHEGGLITTNDDNAAWNYFVTSSNPIYTAVRYNTPAHEADGKTCLSGGDSHAAADIICYMNGYNDPRRAKYFTKSEWKDEEYVAAWDFYDLEEDPHENHNLYNDPKYAPIIRQMKKDLLNLRKEVGDTDEKYPEMQELLEKYYK